MRRHLREIPPSIAQNVRKCVRDATNQSYGPISISPAWILTTRRNSTILPVLSLCRCRKFLAKLLPISKQTLGNVAHLRKDNTMVGGSRHSVATCIRSLVWILLLFLILPLSTLHQHVQILKFLSLWIMKSLSVHAAREICTCQPLITRKVTATACEATVFHRNHGAW